MEYNSEDIGEMLRIYGDIRELLVREEHTPRNPQIIVNLDHNISLYFQKIPKEIRDSIPNGAPDSSWRSFQRDLQERIKFKSE